MERVDVEPGRVARRIKRRLPNGYGESPRCVLQAMGIGRDLRGFRSRHEDVLDLPAHLNGPAIFGNSIAFGFIRMCSLWVLRGSRRWAMSAAFFQLLTNEAIGCATGRKPAWATMFWTGVSVEDARPSIHRRHLRHVPAADPIHFVQPLIASLAGCDLGAFIG